MSQRSTLLLEHHLKELRLPSFLREYGKMAAQCAAENVDHPEYLLRLAELELIDRHQRMVERRIRAARFPAVKSLDTFDFPAIPSVNKALVMELARCEYIERRENVIAVGNSGTGKTHVALGLGLAACQRGMSVGFTTAAGLVHELMEARDERRLLNLQRQLSRLNLLIIDELGFVPAVPHRSGTALRRIFRRYEFPARAWTRIVRGASPIGEQEGLAPSSPTNELPWTASGPSVSGSMICRLTGNAAGYRLTHHVLILEMRIGLRAGLSRTGCGTFTRRCADGRELDPRSSVEQRRDREAGSSSSRPPFSPTCPSDEWTEVFRGSVQND